MSRLPRLAPRILERRLDNGLRLVMLPDPSSSLVAINLWYHVGSKDDPRGRSGLAHLFEHMLFQGSAHVGANEHFQLVQQVGGNANGSTSFDRTNYYETLPPHCLELGLWLESDRMGFLLPALDEEKFEGQRSVVGNERLQRIDNQPYGRAFEEVQAALFPENHPYKRPIIGHMRDIQAATLEDAKEFFADHYHPSNAVLSLVGCFDPDHAENLVKRYFDEIPPSLRTAEPPPPGPDSRSPGAKVTLEDDIALSRVYMAWEGPAITTEERYAGEILATVLAGGKSSPLYQDLVHREQLAQDVSAIPISLELGSILLLVATARPGVALETIEERLDRHLTTISREVPSQDDFVRARNQVVTGLFEQLESVESIADLLSQAATFLGDPASIDNESKLYLDRTPEDLVSFANRFLDPETALRVRVVPRAETTPSS